MQATMSASNKRKHNDTSSSSSSGLLIYNASIVASSDDPTLYSWMAIKDGLVEVCVHSFFAF
jgi:hypothetical protein